jgi:lauroyl/myristoyl acyltransferase
VHLRDVQQRLNGNGVVSMYADHLHGTRNLEVPFLDGRLSLSTQPVSLAISEGAALLPTFPVSDRPGEFRVIVQPAVVPDRAADHRAAVESVLIQQARRRESYVLQYPDQWQSWWRVRP